MKSDSQHNGRAAVEGFSIATQKFCNLIDSSPKLCTSKFLTNVASSLAELYSLAILLPYVESNSEENLTLEKDVTERAEHYRKISSRLAEILGDSNAYWDVFNPLDKGSLVTTTLSDDLSDIYLDLSDSLKASQGNSRPDELIWQWRFDFRSHWGRHAVSALTILHHLTAWDYENKER